MAKKPRSTAGKTKKKVTVHRKGKTFQQTRLVKSESAPPTGMRRHLKTIAKGALIGAGAAVAIGGAMLARHALRTKYGSGNIGSGLRASASQHLSGPTRLGKLHRAVGANIDDMRDSARGVAAGAQRGLAKTRGSIKGAATRLANGMNDRVARSTARTAATPVKTPGFFGRALKGAFGSLKGHRSFGSGLSAEHAQRVGLRG